VVFDGSKHPRGTGAKGGQFVAKGASSESDTVGYDAKTGSGAGYGVKGGDKRVKQLQTLLNSLGMKDASGNPLKVDGKLGPRTTAAIKRLQHRLGLPADGKVSPALLKRIRAAAHKPGAHKPAAHHHRAAPAHKPAVHKPAVHKPAVHKPAAHHAAHKAAPHKAPAKAKPRPGLTHDQRVSMAMLQRI
jgi:hypothetical protein